MKRYELKQGNRIISDNKPISYRVVEGYAFVSVIIALPSGETIKKKSIGVASSGQIIPNLKGDILYVDKEYSCFIFIEAKGNSVIEEIESEESHIVNFLDLIGYRSRDDENPYDRKDIFLHLVQDYFYEENKKELLIERNLENHRNSILKNQKTMLSAYHLSKAQSDDGANYENEKLYDSVRFLCQKFGIRIAKLSEIKRLSGDNYAVEDIAKYSGFLCREVSLDGNFHKMDIPPLICFEKDTKNPLVIFQNTLNLKYVYHPGEKTVKRFTKKQAMNIDSKAFCVHRPLNDANLSIKQIIKFGAKDFSLADFAFILLAMFLVTRVGIGVSNLHSVLYDKIIPHGNVNNLLDYGLILLGCMIGSLLFSLTKSITEFRQNNRIKYSLQAAIYNRIYHMPERFYRKHDSGELAYRAGSAAGSYYGVYSTTVAMLLQFSFSWMYFSRMVKYSAGLAGVGVVFALISVVINLLINQMFLRYRRKQSSIMGKIKSFQYQLFSGITTIRALGAEDAVLYEYMDKAADWSVSNYRYGVGSRITEVTGLTLTCFSTLYIYVYVMKDMSSITVGQFMGFTTVFAMFTGAISSVANQISMIYSMLPMIKTSTEILRTTPENHSDGVIVSEVNGDIKVNNLSFAYEKSNPVLKDLNIHIKPGEYVAIVGATGCGKSTLLKLLLGFEEPTKGQILYDNLLLERLNKPELRSHFGVVLQEDGLFMGSIYKNIVMAKANLTEEDVVKVLEKLGLAEDIAKMPLGLMTPVSEDGCTISGGQKQRVLLARALIGNPEILFLDEATSALDNISQKIVSDAIQNLDITRVVIAHRLSTIINCDRIIVLNKGKIEEEGSYSELMEKNGLFKTLVENQKLD